MNSSAEQRKEVKWVGADSEKSDTDNGVLHDEFEELCGVDTKPKGLEG